MAGLNQTFYHETVDGNQILAYISKKSGHDNSEVFQQYLTTTKVPELHLYHDELRHRMYYRWANTVAGFDLPLVFRGNGQEIKIVPEEEWEYITLSEQEEKLFDPKAIEYMYYIKVMEMKDME